MKVPGALRSLLSPRDAAARRSRTRRSLLPGLLAALCGTAMLLPAHAPAQWAPSKPMRLILRAPPGGADDLQARLLAAQLRLRVEVAGHAGLAQGSGQGHQDAGAVLALRQEAGLPSRELPAVLVGKCNQFFELRRTHYRAGWIAR